MSTLTWVLEEPIHLSCKLTAGWGVATVNEMAPVFSRLSLLRRH